MEHKFFEIRDEGTHIPALAIKITHDDCDSNYPLRRAGFRQEYAILIQLASMRCQYDPHSWGGRTMPCAHEFIWDNFDKLQSGQVIDVRYILGETAAPAESENKR